MHDNNTGKPPLDNPNFQINNNTIARGKFFQDLSPEEIQSPDGMNSTTGEWVNVKTDQPLLLTDEARANKFVKEVAEALTNYYEVQLKQAIESGFTGLYVYFNDMIEHFALKWQNPEPEDKSCEVTFSLDPHPFQHRDEWEAYGIIIEPCTVSDRHILNMRIRVMLHGVDLISRGKLWPDDRASMKYVQYDGIFIGFDKSKTAPAPWGEPTFKELITTEPEIRWHRMVLQSVLHHMNCGDEIPIPMKALMDIARYDRLPDKDEFLKAVEKYQMMEALQ